jgi:O-antigen/teichoic acid export membrane protein
MVRTLKTNGAYALGSAANSAALFLLIPYLINALSLEEYGLWALYEIGIMLIGLLIMVGSDVGLMREYWASPDAATRQRIAGTVITMTVCWGLLLTAGLALLLLLLAPQLEFQLQDMLLLLGIALAETLFNLLITLFRIREEAIQFAALSFGRMLLFLLAAVLGVQVIGGVSGALFGRLIAAAIGLGLVSVLIWKIIEPGFDRQIFARVLHYGLPLLPTNLALYVLLASDRYLLQLSASLATVGIYAFAYKIGMVLDILVTRPFALDWGPRRFKIAGHPQAQQKYVSALILYLFVAALIATLVLTLTPLVYAWIAPEAYLPGIAIVPLILFANIIYGASYPVNVGLMIKDQTRYLPIISWLAAGLCLALGVWLIPQFAMIGAAIATLLSYTCFTLIMAIVSKRFYAVPYLNRQLLIVIAGLLLGFGSIALASTYWSEHNPLWFAVAGIGWTGLVFGMVAYMLWGRQGVNSVLAQIRVKVS